MKELEKTKRISIASVLFILVILIGVLSFKRPKFSYTINSKLMLEQIVAHNYLISMNELDLVTNAVLIDVRSPYEFNKGALENAINIYTPDILLDENMKLFNKMKTENTPIILYGKTPDEALEAYMILYQLGYNNLKILTVENSYTQNKIITKNIPIEKLENDINNFIQESIKKAAVEPKPIQVIKPAPKKVIPVQKKKKMPVEGGC
jgi:rhodanese-related sulfurtransferase